MTMTFEDLLQKDREAAGLEKPEGGVEREATPQIEPVQVDTESASFEDLMAIDSVGKVEQEATTTKEDLFKGEYGPSDLLEGDRFAVMDKALKSRFGIEEIDGYTKEEKLDKFLNWMRYFDAGNTVQTAFELDHILSSEDEARKTYLEGFQLFDGLGGITSDSYSWGDTLEGVKDYAWGALADPVNILAPVYGKAFATGGVKGVSTIAKKLAVREFKRQVKKGASKSVAIKAANKVKGVALKRAYRDQGKKIAFREAVGAGAFDTVVAMGTELARQNGLIQIGDRKETSNIEVGLAALGGLVGGGIGLGTAKARGLAQLPMANTAIKDLSITDANDLTGVVASLARDIKKLPKDRMAKYAEGFKAKVARGEELDVLDTDFFGKLVLGDEELGFEGLAYNLYRRGFVWRGKRFSDHPRFGDDNFSNWFADALRHAPEQDVLDFVKAFKEASGVDVAKVFKAGEGVSAERKVMNVIADNLAKKVSDSAKTMGRQGYAAKLLGGKFKPKDIGLEEYTRAVFGPEFVDMTAKEVTKAEGSLAKFLEPKWRGVSHLQDMYIRLLVAHPGTSAMNIIGWGTKSTLQSTSDMLRTTAINGSKSLWGVLAGNPKNAQLNWQIMASAYKANMWKLKNLVDPEMTADAFQSLVEKYPERFRELSGVLPGGVTYKDAAEFGLEEAGKFEKGSEKFINAIHKVSLVKAQDIFTKSQEYMYNLDLALRETRGMSYRELISRPDASILMQDEGVIKAMNIATRRTLENIMSKSYANSKVKGISFLATGIEKAREVPIIGAQVPFGRFFNNTVATAADMSGVTAALKPFVRVAEDTPMSELLAKAAVSYTAVGFMVSKEMEYIDRGIAWDQEIDESTGERRSIRYDAPASSLKAAARVVAHRLRGDEVPKDLVVDEAKAIFGQLTRQINSSANDIGEVFVSAVSGEGEDTLNLIGQLVGATASTYISGSTRFLEPLNVASGLLESPEDYTAKDVKQGNKTLASSIRYMDSLLGTAVGYHGAEKQSAMSPYASRQPGKLIGDRAIEPTTPSTRVFAMIGRPEWDVGIRADSPEAKALITEYFQPIFENEAAKLLDTPQFVKGSIKYKQQKVREALSHSRKMARKLMSNSGEIKDRRMELIFDMTSRRKLSSVEKYAEELGYKGEILDLSFEQLELLKYFIDSEEDRLEEEAYK